MSVYSKMSSVYIVLDHIILVLTWMMVQTISYTEARFKLLIKEYISSHLTNCYTRYTDIV